MSSIFTMGLDIGKEISAHMNRLSGQGLDTDTQLCHVDRLVSAKTHKVFLRLMDLESDQETQRYQVYLDKRIEDIADTR